MRQRLSLSVLLLLTHLYFSLGLNYSGSSVTHNHEVNHSSSRRVRHLQPFIDTLNPQELCDWLTLDSVVPSGYVLQSFY